jgi:hypothetical protein
LIGDAGDDELG